MELEPGGETGKEPGELERRQLALMNLWCVCVATCKGMQAEQIAARTKFQREVRIH